MPIKLKKQILEAIDALRGRKARPDVERICNHLQRKHNVEPRETLADLEKLVDHEYVIRVEYKGNISYRNAAKWPRFNVCKNKQDAAGMILLSASESTRKILVSALVELIKRNANYGDIGVPYNEIQSSLIQNDDLQRFKDCDYLDAIIALEINHGNVDMLENGYFAPEPRVKFPDEEKLNDDVKVEGVKLSPAPKKVIKPWMLDEIKKEMAHDKSFDAEKNTDLNSGNSKIISILKICKTLRDAESKKINKIEKERVKFNRIIGKSPIYSSAVVPTAAPPDEGASPPTGGKNHATASRVGSRRKLKMSFKRTSTPSSSSDEAEEKPKNDFFMSLPENSKRQRRARQVFDPSDNNLPRNRLKRGRPPLGSSSPTKPNAAPSSATKLSAGPASSSTTKLSTGTNSSKQLQQHVLQHQSLLRVHQQKLSRPQSPEREEEEDEPPPAKVSRTSIAKQSNKTKSPKPPPPPRSPSPAPPSVTSTSEMSDISSCCIICKGDFSAKAVRIIYCNSCDARVHPVCLRNVPDQTIQPPLNHKVKEKWRCMECRSCTICGKGKDDKEEWMVVCQNCDESFHASCHSPALLRIPQIKWVCYRCTVEKAISVGENLVTYGDKYPSASVPILYSPTSTPSMNGDEDHAIACNGVDTEEFGDVPQWNCERVVEYFTEHGFQDEMPIFKEQAIDGKSLLLMKRMDILRGLGLKLGPALKIYSHVAHMQLTHFGHVPS
ncbi:hypothetical protein B566_EDAN010570 [Ephemera danica]|nr:hypothetical protein B566_EDAN010570 [Ephemera danica]